MVNNAQKTPFARSLELFAAGKISGAEALRGKSLPASVVKVVSSGIVTVKFEVTVPYTINSITVPVEGSEYVRLPIQAGMLGWVKPSDAYLGGVSGLGGGTADLSPRPNLSNLVWSPIGNVNWSSADDPDKVVIYGPDGAVIRDQSKNNVLDVNAGGVTLTVTAGGVTITMTSGQPVTIAGDVVVSGSLNLGGSIHSQNGGVYGGDIHTAGAVVAGFGTGNQVGLNTHDHSSVQPGSGQSGPPVPGT